MHNEYTDLCLRNGLDVVRVHCAVPESPVGLAEYHFSRDRTDDACDGGNRQGCQKRDKGAVCQEKDGMMLVGFFECVPVRRLPESRLPPCPLGSPDIESTG